MVHHMDENVGRLMDAIEEMGIELAGMIPADSSVNELDAWGRPLVELSHDSPAASSIWQIAEKYVGKVGVSAN